MERLGISSGVLASWFRGERRGEARRDGVGPRRFARVRLLGSARGSSPSAVILLRGGRRVRVAAGFDAAEVVRLVKALESC